ncbi:hypothetical protein SCUCBS95973_003410 [Sporothrix curviconia]|uniref:Uncharacterized protein n=1 Tax=Sporothrix curviconia TaxID=1260050 RepID=A0ABP0BF09_9PEZI
MVNGLVNTSDVWSPPSSGTTSQQMTRPAPAGAPLHIRDLLLQLVRLGRQGHWVLHTQDIYCPEYDTRPQTRDPRREVKIYSAAGPGLLLTDTGLVWAADSLSTPRFDDLAFWGEKKAELLEKIALTRASSKARGIAIPGITSPKLANAVELRWAGDGLRPDLDDEEFWGSTAKRLAHKVNKAREGHIHPAFNPAELHVLATLESQDDHFFSRYRHEVKQLSPDKEAAACALAAARSRVRELLADLWHAGLPGRWMLHNLDVCAVDYNTRHLSQDTVDVVCEEREDDNDGNENTANTDRMWPIRPVMGKMSPGTYGLCYRGADRPPAELDHAAYWLKLARTLEKKLDDACEGRIQHRFIPHERQALQLADRSHGPDPGVFGDEGKKLDDRINGRLSRSNR